MTSPQRQIRNVALIAHINHGKSTLADRLLERTGTIPPLKMREQFLDNMELERERGVTIKLKTVRMRYKLPKDLKETFNFRFGESPLADEFCTLNLLDTPGHVDFSYEVSRSLAACEGAILIVDAVSGIQAQTVAHTKKAQELGLKIIPVVNKIDLEVAEPEKIAIDLIRTFGFARDEILFASAKAAKGTDEILRAVVERITSPQGNSEKPLRALIFDSTYNEHKGAIAFVKIVDGNFILNGKLLFMASVAECEPIEIGYFAPEMKPAKGLSAGEIGYIATGFKDTNLVRVGDTITNVKNDVLPERGGSGFPALGSGRLFSSASSPRTEPRGIRRFENKEVEPLPGYEEPKPVVFVSFYPLDNKEFPELEMALTKLQLTDPSISFQKESSFLGQGFRGGFLGVFHAEIVKERLERDYGLEVFATSPSVEYEFDGRTIKKPADLPQITAEVLEPWVRIVIFTPKEYLGPIMQLSKEKRGAYLSTDYPSESQAKLGYEMPLAELIGDFFDRLKSITSGFASLDYEMIDPRPAEVSRLDILVAGERVEPLARIVLREKAAEVGRLVVGELKKVIPKQQFAIALQAAVGGKILARETIPALRKDVTAKLYGGDVTRKRKLLEKQKAGKKRLKKFGRVDLPQEAFLAVK